MNESGVALSTTFVIVDTDIVIDAGRGDAEAASFLIRAEQQGAVAISTITRMELIVGCRNKVDLRALERFLVPFHELELTQRISTIAIESLLCYRLSPGLLYGIRLIRWCIVRSRQCAVCDGERFAHDAAAGILACGQNDDACGRCTSIHPKSVLLADSLIAATAITARAPFATKNRRDFRFIDGLYLLAYPGIGEALSVEKGSGH